MTKLSITLEHPCKHIWWAPGKVPCSIYSDNPLTLKKCYTRLYIHIPSSLVILGSFSADSYVLQYNGDDSVVYMYPEKRYRTQNDHIAINFKTLEQDGLLLHSEGIQGDLLTLELKRGRLYLHISLGTVLCWKRPYWVMSGKNIGLWDNDIR